MLHIDEIKLKLNRAGFNEDQVNVVIVDVTRIALEKTLTTYFSELPVDDQKKIQTLRPEEIQLYISENKDHLPKAAKGVFEKTYDDVWEEYFASISG